MTRKEVFQRKEEVFLNPILKAVAERISSLGREGVIDLINGIDGMQEVKVIFSKIATSPEPSRLDLDILERDINGEGEDLVIDGWINFENRLGLYEKAAKKQKLLGLSIEVKKEVVDEKDLVGIDRARFNYQLNPVLYEITRRIDFIVFEKTPNNITIAPRGFLGERVFDLRSKTTIGNMRAYLGEIITKGGDISGMEHKLPYIQRGIGVGWGGKGSF